MTPICIVCKAKLDLPESVMETVQCICEECAEEHEGRRVGDFLLIEPEDD